MTDRDEYVDVMSSRVPGRDYHRGHEVSTTVLNITGTEFVTSAFGLDYYRIVIKALFAQPRDK